MAAHGIGRCRWRFSRWMTSGTAAKIVTSERGRVINFHPIWSRDDRRILYASNRSGDWEMYQRAAEPGDSDERLLSRSGFQAPASVGPDGTLAFVEDAPETGQDIWLLDPVGDLRPFRVTRSREAQPRFSPDGSLLAFYSNESGPDEVYVAPLDGGAPRRISRGGGVDPIWAPSGRMLFYTTADAMEAVVVGADGTPDDGSRERIDVPDFLPNRFGRGFDVAADGRVLVVVPQPGALPDRIEVVLNWLQDLRAVVEPGR